jgi:phosphatidylglycerol:prolipoprotein diacylglycerol transferase
MRHVLFWITFDAPWAFGAGDPEQGNSLFGSAWVFLLLAAGWTIYLVAIGKSSRQNWIMPAAACLGGALVLTFTGWLLKAVQPAVVHIVPMHGYGFMIVVGFLTGLWWAQRLAKSIGLDPEIVSDAGIWLLATAVIGGRLEFLRQYHEVVFRNAKGPGDILLRAVNLQGGGLVLVGALVGGTLGVIIFALRRKLSPWMLLDVVMPSAFIGIGFGRLGCLLNGCCFGDPCTLPWGIEFAKGTVPFKEIMNRGFLVPDAVATMPLHPTQVYMSIDGFIVAAVTTLYFPLRRWNGELLAISAMCYALSRFLIEFLRWDEMGQIATALTISQIYSLVIFAVGLAAWLFCQARYGSRPPLGQSLATAK